VCVYSDRARVNPFWIRRQVKLLLLCGANVNAKDYDRRTAMHVAAAEGNLSLVQLLAQV